MSTNPPPPSTAQISYSLLEDRSGDHKYFRIDPELGFIYTQSVFDRETKSSYLLEVQSVDGWESARPGKHGQPNSGKHGPAFLNNYFWVVAKGLTSIFQTAKVEVKAINWSA